MLPKGPYEPTKEEQEILKYWLDNKFFKPEYHAERGLLTTEEMKADGRQAFCIVNPPPNAYMRPHVGNVSGYAYQDVFLRFNRMNGKKVLGQPGKDHAGIQGEVVVEKIFIENKGKTKYDMGREKFYLSAYDHFVKMMPKVMADEQRIGLSADYDRNLFTLDPKVVDTVLGTFVKLYSDKMVYKGVRIVNWDPKAQTTLADIDTERLERETELVYINYPLVRQQSWYLSFYDQPTLEAIRIGKKTIETRALNPEEPQRYFGDMKAGDLCVCVEKSGEKVHHIYKIIKSVTKYNNIEDALLKLDWKKVSAKKPDSVADLEQGYNKLSPNYAQKINKNGLIAIELEYLSTQDYLSVATTRAETMLGDTAVIVNPSDKRYSDVIGHSVVIPIVNREVPVITSPRVEKDFGTGAVKLTPAHAYDDYVMMTEWNEANPDKAVSYINIIDKKAEMAGPVPAKYLGMHADKARQIVKEDLGSLVVKTEKHQQSIMIGERSKAVIEQIMSSQWFVDVEKLKEPAIAAVKNGEVKIHPNYMTKKYLMWMENLRDWPVSRSLWWGYRIPVWYKGEILEIVDTSGKIVETIDGQVIENIFDAVQKGLAKVQLENPGAGWVQDKDVFDTWFSSGQWPYATLKANDLMDTFFPSDIMETGYDILELWVSRMIMLSLYHEGKVPFRDVYLHGLVKAPDGQKMSKSKNNVVAPEEIINKFGADSLRLLFVVGNKAGSGYPVSYEKLEGHKRFLNKIWNASKFVLGFVTQEDANLKLKKENLDLVDKTLLDDLNKLAKKISLHFNKFQIGLASEELYQQFWHDYCDIYLEAVKPRLYEKDREGNPINTSEAEQASMLSAKYALLTALKTYLKLLHPIVPFITERIWSELPKAEGESKTIMYAAWPN